MFQVLDAVLKLLGVLQACNAALRAGLACVTALIAPKPPRNLTYYFDNIQLLVRHCCD